MRSIYLLLSLFLGLSLVTACASAGNQRPGGDPSELLSGQQLRASSATSLEDAIQELRPRWLTNRDNVRPTRDGGIEVCKGILVFIDGRRARRTLVQIPMSGIAEVRYTRPRRVRPDGSEVCPSLAAVNVITTR